MLALQAVIAGLTAEAAAALLKAFVYQGNIQSKQALHTGSFEAHGCLQCDAPAL